MATATEFVKAREVFEQTFTLTYADSTASVVATLPGGARIIAVFINVTTAFSGGTTTMGMGTSSSANEIISGESVAAAGNIDIGAHLVDAGHETTTPTNIYAAVGASNTAGQADVTILFSLDRFLRH